MSIYRGAGGSGDATADSSSEALLVRELAAEVQIDADAASASATSASGSATSAASSATAAATSATNAASSATSAASSASTATTKASEASTSATNAAASATAAQTAETNAETAETNAETAETNAAASATTASTQATNASNSATSAATSATNASNSASAAATSATNAASSATSAAGSATTATTQASNASTSATNAASSATSAAGSATTATTQAGIATTQATNAASSASAAATSATNASNSATSASTSASTATTQASNSASSATASASSASDAAASAAAAAASYDSFDDRYLGSKSVAPTLDNDGNALVTGALYYNNGTVTPADKGMYVYDGATWIAASAASTAILTVFKYTATAAQTTFTGVDDNALTLTYTAGSAIITVNGAVMEVGTDVTATTGTSIVLAQAALAGDEVNIYAFATFNIANTYTQAQVDAGFLTKSNPSYTGTLTGGTGVVNLGSGQFYKDSSGNVGIGTSSPTQKLTVAGGVASNGGISALAPSTTFFDFNSGFGRFSAVSGTTGTAAPITLSQYSSNGSVGRDALLIDSSGNVGIGTSSPTGKLDVVSSSSLVGRFYNNAGRGQVAVDGTSDSSFVIRRNGTQIGWIQSDSSGLEINTGTNGAHPYAFYTNNTERMRIDSSGNLLVGTTSSNVGFTTGNKSICMNNSYGSAYAISINDNTGGNGYFLGFGRNGTQCGYIWTNGANSTQYVTSSDYRLKENITPMIGALDKVSALKPVTYTWKEDGSPSQGFIAHELQAVIPEAVAGEKDGTRIEQYEITPAIPATLDEEGNELTPAVEAVMAEREVPSYQGIDTSFLVATLTAAIQEQQAMINELKARIEVLETN